MKYSFRQKIQILRSILKEYAIYFKYFKSANCYARGKNIVITFEDGYRYGLFLKRKFPKRETDKVIARYRAKLYNEKKKFKSNYRKQKLLRQRTRYE